MLIVQAILLGALHWIDEVNPPSVRLRTVQRPLVCGWIVGIIPGDASTGVIAGAFISLVYSGLIPVRGSIPTDMALTGTLGTVFAIIDNLDADTALALAVSVGLLGAPVWYCHTTSDSIFVHIGDGFVEKEQYSKTWIANILLSQIMATAIYIAPCFLAAYPGATHTQGLTAMLTGISLKIFQIIGGLMLTSGIAIILQYIFKRESRVSLFIGFVVAVCSGFTLLPPGVLSLSYALVYVQARYREGSGKDNIAGELELKEDF